MANPENKYSIIKVIIGFVGLFLAVFGLIFYLSVESSRDKNPRERIERV